MTAYNDEGYDHQSDDVFQVHRQSQNPASFDELSDGLSRRLSDTRKPMTCRTRLPGGEPRKCQTRRVDPRACLAAMAAR
jgi:hypothetical protein